ncbi:MAG TPA: hypothetical protein VN180_10280 [Acidimicrobiia bacterium]|nr:hypothetical protein [Acidimicrobiia bacterium]
MYHPSWPAFALEAAALLALRSLFVTAVVQAAWPSSVPRPPFLAEWRRVARFIGIVTLALLPFAVLAFATAVTALSWLFYVSVPVLVMAAALVHPGVVTASWWRDRPTWETVRVILLAFVLLTAAGAVLSAAPTWAQPPLAGLAGLGDAWCWLRIVHARAGVAPQARRRPFVVVALAGIVALVVGGTAAGFAVSIAVQNGRTPVPPVSASATGPPVLIVKGFNSQWDGVTRRWVHGRYRIRRFSYAGLDAHGEPRQYGRADTHQSLPALAHELRTQVDAFHAATGQPVSIVAESEGALVTLAYLAATPGAPVPAVVALSPLLLPGRVYYPRIGAAGWGTAAGTVMDGLARALSGVGPVDVSADTGLFRSFVDEGPALQGLLRCAPPRVRSLAVIPLDSGVASPAPVTVGLPHAVVPAFHGGLLGDHTTQRLIDDVLAGRPATGSGVWAGTGDVVGALAAGWQAPGLAPGLEPAWRTLPAPSDCAGVRAAIRRYVNGSTTR